MYLAIWKVFIYICVCVRGVHENPSLTRETEPQVVLSPSEGTISTRTQLTHQILSDESNLHSHHAVSSSSVSPDTVVVRRPDQEMALSPHPLWLHAHDRCWPGPSLDSFDWGTCL